MTSGERCGRFITVEGIEGVGKTTSLSFVRERLEAAGVAVDVTREPGGTPLAERIRVLLLEQGDAPMPELSELLLMFAARAAHLAQRIAPALAEGTWVLCDRFTDATLAYQGGGRGLASARIAALADWVHPHCWPDLTILLDAPVEVGLARARRRSTPDRFEREQAAFFERVRAAYRRLAAEQPQRIRLVDAARPLEAVQGEIGAVLDEFLQRVAAGRA